MSPMKDTKFYENIGKLGHQELMSRQLKNQVDITWPKEALSLEAHGLKNAKRILDIGSGNGYFLCRLARHYPKKQFIGVDASEDFVNESRKLIKHYKLKNVTVIHSRCPSNAVKGRFDFIYSRLMIYCTNNRSEILGWARKLLKNNGRMCIADVDDGFMISHPSQSGLIELFKSLDKLCGSLGVDRFVARKLPHLLLKAGFGDIEMDAKYWFSSFAMAKDQYKSYWKHFVKLVEMQFGKQLPKKLLSRAIADIDKVARSRSDTVLFPFFFVSGKK